MITPIRKQCEMVAREVLKPMWDFNLRCSVNMHLQRKGCDYIKALDSESEATPGLPVAQRAVLHNGGWPPRVVATEGHRLRHIPRFGRDTAGLCSCAPSLPKAPLLRVTPSYGHLRVGSRASLHGAHTGEGWRYITPASKVYRLGPMPSPVRALGNADELKNVQPSHAGIGVAIVVSCPAFCESQRSSIAVSSCVVLWQCST